MAKVVTQYREVLEDARARFDRLTQRAAIGPLHTLYDNALQELDRKLSRAKSGTMTAAQLQLLKLQATIAVNNLQNQMAAQVGAASHQAQVESLRSLAHNVRDMERFKGAAVAMPIEEASQFHGLIAGRRTSLLRAHESSMQNYGVNTVNSIEQALALGISVGESGRDLTDRVLNTFDGERWAAERIARTEVAWAYNATAVDAVKAAREELPDLMLRWSEHCSDDYIPLDDRVGLDSIAMHGQVVEPGGLFVMPTTTPDGQPVPNSLVGLAWEFPPNRPNDRAVVAPWRPDWGTLGWTLIGDERVQVTPELLERMGSVDADNS